MFHIPVFACDPLADALQGIPDMPLWLSRHAWKNTVFGDLAKSDPK